MGVCPVVLRYPDTLPLFAFRLVLVCLSAVLAGKLRKVCAANRACLNLTRLFSRMENKAQVSRMNRKAYSKQSPLTRIVAAYGCSIRLSMIACYAFEYSKQAQTTRIRVNFDCVRVFASMLIASSIAATTLALNSCFPSFIRLPAFHGYFYGQIARSGCNEVQGLRRLRSSATAHTG